MADAHHRTYNIAWAAVALIDHAQMRRYMREKTKFADAFRRRSVLVKAHINVCFLKIDGISMFLISKHLR